MRTINEYEQGFGGLNIASLGYTFDKGLHQNFGNAKFHNFCRNIFQDSIATFEHGFPLYNHSFDSNVTLGKLILETNA